MTPTTIDTTAATEERVVTPIGFDNPVYGEIIGFLWAEAALLDHDRQHEWLALMDDGIIYAMPARETLARADGSGIDERGGQFNDTILGLRLRVKHNMDIPHAFDRDPPPRTRRFVTNVLAYETDDPATYRVDSYVLLIRNQFDLSSSDMLTGERQDLLRKTADGWRIMRRKVLLDVCNMPDPMSNVFI